MSFIKIKYEAKFIKDHLELRQSGKPTNLQIVSQNGSISVHRQVMATFSEPFSKIPAVTSVIHRDDADIEDLAALVDFAYSGNCCILKTRLSSLGKLSKDLGFETLHKIIENMITAQNEVGSAFTLGNYVYKLDLPPDVVSEKRKANQLQPNVNESAEPPASASNRQQPNPVSSATETSSSIKVEKPNAVNSDHDYSSTDSSNEVCAKDVNSSSPNVADSVSSVIAPVISVDEIRQDKAHKDQDTGDVQTRVKDGNQINVNISNQVSALISNQNTIDDDVIILEHENTTPVSKKRTASTSGKQQASDEKSPLTKKRMTSMNEIPNKKQADANRNPILMDTSPTTSKAMTTTKIAPSNIPPPTSTPTTVIISTGALSKAIAIDPSTTSPSTQNTTITGKSILSAAPLTGQTVTFSVSNGGGNVLVTSPSIFQLAAINGMKTYSQIPQINKSSVGQPRTTPITTATSILPRSQPRSLTTTPTITRPVIIPVAPLSVPLQRFVSASSPLTTTITMAESVANVGVNKPNIIKNGTAHRPPNLVSSNNTKNNNSVNSPNSTDKQNPITTSASKTRPHIISHQSPSNIVAAHRELMEKGKQEQEKAKQEQEKARQERQRQLQKLLEQQEKLQQEERELSERVRLDKLKRQQARQETNIPQSDPPKEQPPPEPQPSAQTALQPTRRSLRKVASIASPEDKQNETQPTYKRLWQANEIIKLLEAWAKEPANSGNDFCRLELKKAGIEKTEAQIYNRKYQFKQFWSEYKNTGHKHQTIEPYTHLLEKIHELNQRKSRK